MKKDIIYSVLDYSDGIEQVILNEGKNSISSDMLLNILRAGIKTKELDNAEKIEGKKVTKYIFEAKSHDNEIDKNIKGSIVVEVKNSQKQYLTTTLASIDDMCVMTSQLKKINRSRVIAGIAAGLVILTVAGHTVAKGLNKCLKEDYEHEKESSVEDYEKYVTSRKPIAEEIDQSEEEYYMDLEQRAKNGDEDAIKEYSEYLVEQQLIEQRESGSKTR